MVRHTKREACFYNNNCHGTVLIKNKSFRPIRQQIIKDQLDK